MNCQKKGFWAFRKQANTSLPGVSRKSIHQGHTVQSVGAPEAVSWAIGHNPGQVTTLTPYTSKLALILPTSKG